MELNVSSSIHAQNVKPFAIKPSLVVVQATHIRVANFYQNQLHHEANQL